MDGEQLRGFSSQQLLQLILQCVSVLIQRYNVGWLVDDAHDFEFVQEQRQQPQAQDQRGSMNQQEALLCLTLTMIKRNLQKKNYVADIFLQESKTRRITMTGMQKTCSKKRGSSRNTFLTLLPPRPWHLVALLLLHSMATVLVLRLNNCWHHSGVPTNASIAQNVAVEASRDMEDIHATNIATGVTSSITNGVTRMEKWQ